MKDFKEKIEGLTSKHIHRWLEPAGYPVPSPSIEKDLAFKIESRVNVLLETIETFEGDFPDLAKEKIRERMEALENEMREKAKEVDALEVTSTHTTLEGEKAKKRDKFRIVSEIERDGEKAFIVEHTTNQTKIDYGYLVARNQPEIDFWEWFLEVESEQKEQPNKDQEPEENEANKAPLKKKVAQEVKEVEAPNRKAEQPGQSETVEVPIKEKEPPETEQVEQIEQSKKSGKVKEVKGRDEKKHNPHEGLSARQFALIIYYRWEAGERGLIPPGGKLKAIEGFAETIGVHPKNFQQIFNRISNAKTGKAEREKHTSDNIKDHQVILPLLNDYETAKRLAKKNMKTIQENW